MKAWISVTERLFYEFETQRRGHSPRHIATGDGLPILEAHSPLPHRFLGVWQDDSCLF